MKKIYRLFFGSCSLFLVGIGLSTPTFAQPGQEQVTDPSTIRIAANDKYDKAGKVKRIMLGEHYRREWATQVELEILDLDTYEGGLTPVKMGGGLQTKSLRLKAANGKEFVLRSVNKDPSKALVSELRGTFAEDVVQDQISSSNPYAPLTVSYLANAAGIMNSAPKIVYVPAVASLGEFEKTFGGTICLLEERPSGNEEDNAAFGNSKNVVNSEKLFEKVFSNSHHRMDEKAYLRARLFDMLIGDWDRHEDQWLWASFKEGNETIYRPIPRDRDQAFARLDGFIPHLMTRKWALRKAQDYDYHLRDVAGLATSAIHLDRNFTSRLTKSEWMEVATQLRKAMTNNVIEAAFRQMPTEIYRISGLKTVAKLKSRRDELQQYAMEYYEFLSRQVAVTGTTSKEIFDVTRINDDSTRLVVYSTGVDGNREEIIYDRYFNRSETRELQLYGLEGTDVFNISGTTKKGILVRVIGGKGNDQVTDQSSVKGGSHLTKVYDDAQNTFKTGKETRVLVSTDTLKNDYNRRWYHYDWVLPLPRPGYNPDDGVYLGYGVIIKKQGFGKAPYASVHSIGANYAFKTSAYNFWYHGLFKETVGKWDLDVNAIVNAPNYSRNYFGLGNNTVRYEELDNQYYRVRYNQVATSASLQRLLGTRSLLNIGLDYQAVKVENTDDRFISSDGAKLDSSAFGRKNYGGAHVKYQYSTVKNELYPRKGIRIATSAKYSRNLGESEKDFVQITGEISSYFTIGPATIASRTGIATNLGNGYEFFQANGLGNASNLRGFRKDRFAGKTAVYQNTELRLALGYANLYVTKGAWGVLGFLDRGKVWMPNEDSGKWHSGYGGGIWFMPFNKMALTATYGVSKEDKLVSIGAGFMF